MVSFRLALVLIIHKHLKNRSTGFGVSLSLSFLVSLCLGLISLSLQRCIISSEALLDGHVLYAFDTTHDLFSTDPISLLLFGNPVTRLSRPFALVLDSLFLRA